MHVSGEVVKFVCFLAADLLEAYVQNTGLIYGGKTFSQNEVQSIF